MRSIILATAFMALAPVALAQTYPPGGTAGPGPAAGTSYYPSRAATPSPTATSGQPDPGNSRPWELWNPRRTQGMPTDAAQATTDLSHEPSVMIAALDCGSSATGA